MSDQVLDRHWRLHAAHNTVGLPDGTANRVDIRVLLPRDFRNSAVEFTGIPF